LCLACLASAYAEISAVWPAEGTVGTEITLTGSDFGDKQGKIEVGAKECQVLAWGETQIQCRLTHPQPPGVYTIAVALHGSQNRSEPMTFAGFTMMAPQIVPEATPRLVSAGEAVTVAGALFGDKKGEVWLEDSTGQSQSAKVQDWSMDSISFEIPDGLSGTCLLEVVNEVGLGVQDSWCMFMPPGTPAGTSYYFDHMTHDNATAVYYLGHFWCFYSLHDAPHRIRCSWFENGEFVDYFEVGPAPADVVWLVVQPPAGHTKAQLAPLVIENKLWLFSTGLDGSLFYTRYDGLGRGWESVWNQIPGVFTSGDYEIAPVYNPQTHRLSVYYWYNDSINWVYSDDYGTNWSAGQHVDGIRLVSGAPSALYTPFGHWLTPGGLADTLLVVHLGPLWGDVVGVFPIKNGKAMELTYGWHITEGRPFLMDLNADYYALLWKSPYTGRPVICKMEKATARWQPSYEALAQETKWSPSGAVNYELRADGTGWDATFYLFWGHKGILSTKFAMTSMETWFIPGASPQP